MQLKKKLFCILMMTWILGMTSLCLAETTMKEVKKETKGLLQALKSYTADQRDDAIRKTRTALDNLDKHIDALEKSIDDKWDKMDEAARKDARASLKSLRRQRTRVAEWYGSLKNSTGDTWEQIKIGFSDAYKALQDAWEKSEKEFGSQP